jgi:hypothetical protein
MSVPPNFDDILFGRILNKWYIRIIIVDKNVIGSYYPINLSLELFKDIEHLKVSFDNLETSTNDGLDFERYSALYNAIVRYI